MNNDRVKEFDSKLLIPTFTDNPVWSRYFQDIKAGLSAMPFYSRIEDIYESGGRVLGLQDTYRPWDKQRPLNSVFSVDKLHVTTKTGQTSTKVYVSVVDLACEVSGRKIKVYREDAVDLPNYLTFAEDEDCVTVWWKQEHAGGRLAVVDAVEYAGPKGQRGYELTIDDMHGSDDPEAFPTEYYAVLDTAQDPYSRIVRKIDYSAKLGYGCRNNEDWMITSYVVSNKSDYVVGQLVEIDGKYAVVRSRNGNIIAVASPISDAAKEEFAALWNVELEWDAEATLRSEMELARSAEQVAAIDYAGKRKAVCDKLYVLNSAELLSDPPMSVELYEDVLTSVQNALHRINSGIPIASQEEYAVQGKGYVQVITAAECGVSGAEFPVNAGTVVTLISYHVSVTGAEHGADANTDYRVSPYVFVVPKAARLHITYESDGVGYVMLSNCTRMCTYVPQYNKSTYFVPPSTYTDTWIPTLVDGSKPYTEGLVIPADVTDKFEITTSAGSVEAPSYAVYASSITQDPSYYVFSENAYDGVQFSVAQPVSGASRVGKVTDIRASKLVGRALYPGYLNDVVTADIPSGVIFYTKLARSLAKGSFRAKLKACIEVVTADKASDVECTFGFSKHVPTSDWVETVDPTYDPTEGIQVVVNIDNPEAGTVTGSSVFAPGSTVVCKANLGDSYGVSSWEATFEDGESCTFVPDTKSTKLTFLIPEYVERNRRILIMLNTVVVGPQHAGFAYVTTSVEGGVASIDCDSTIPVESAYGVRAIPNEGYSFVQWTGTLTAYMNSVSSPNATVMLPSTADGASFTLGAIVRKDSKIIKVSSNAPVYGTGTYPSGVKIGLVAENYVDGHAVWSSSYGTVSQVDRGFVLVTPETDVVVNYSMVSGATSQAGLVIASTGGVMGYCLADNYWITSGGSTKIHAYANKGYHFVRWAITGATVYNESSATTVIRCHGDATVTVLTAVFAEGDPQVPNMQPPTQEEMQSAHMSRPSGAPVLQDETPDPISDTSDRLEFIGTISSAVEELEISGNSPDDYAYFYIILPFINVSWDTVPWRCNMYSLKIEMQSNGGLYALYESSNAEATSKIVQLPTYSTVQCYFCVNTSVRTLSDIQRFRVVHMSTSGNIKRIYTAVDLPNRITDESVTNLMDAIGVAENSLSEWKAKCSIAERAERSYNRFIELKGRVPENIGPVTTFADTLDAYVLTKDPTFIARCIIDDNSVRFVSNSWNFINSWRDMSDKYNTKADGGDGHDDADYVTIDVNTVNTQILDPSAVDEDSWLPEYVELNKSVKAWSGDVTKHATRSFIARKYAEYSDFEWYGWFRGSEKLPDEEVVIDGVTCHRVSVVCESSAQLTAAAYSTTFNATLKFKTVTPSKSLYIWGYGAENQSDPLYAASLGILSGHYDIVSGERVNDNRDLVTQIIIDGVPYGNDPAKIGVPGAVKDEHFYTRAFTFAHAGDHVVLAAVNGAINVETKVIDLQHAFHDSDAYRIQFNWLSEEDKGYAGYLTAYAFCGCENLEYMRLLSADVSEHCFDGCKSFKLITNADISTDPDNEYGCFLPNLRVVSESTFDNCTGAEIISLPNVVSVADYGLRKCTAATSIDISSALSVGTEAVYQASKAQRIDVKSVREAGDRAFAEAKVLTLINPRALVIAGSELFMKCEALTQVDMPEVRLNKTEDGYEGTKMFSGCRNLEMVTAPKATTVPESMYSGCAELQRADMHRAAQVGKGAFEGCSKVRAIIADGMFANSDVHLGKVESVGYNAFRGCFAINRLYLPDLEHLEGDSAFSGLYGCTSVNVTEGSGIWIPKVQSIPNSTFASCISLSKGKFAPSVTEFGNFAFQQCAITEVSTQEYKDNMYIPGLTKIPEGMFRSCTSLSKANLTGVTEIGPRAFSGCPSILRLSTENPAFEFYAPDITELPAGIFEDCSQLMYVDIPKITELANGDVAAGIPGVFENCTAFTSISQVLNEANVYMPDVSVIPVRAFAGCVAIASADLSKATAIRTRAFYNCSAIAYLVDDDSHPDNGVKLPASLSVIEGDEVFARCFHLSAVKLDNVKTIGTSAFAECYALTEVSMRSLEFVDDTMFQDCNNLKKVTCKFCTGSDTLGSRKILSRKEVKGAYEYTLVTV